MREGRDFLLANVRNLAQPSRWWRVKRSESPRNLRNDVHFRRLFGLGQEGGSGGLEEVLAADDPNGLVIDLDRVDGRADIAFAGVGVSRIQLRVHQSREDVDLIRAPVELSERALIATVYRSIEHGIVGDALGVGNHAIFAIAQFLP
jgi:hypothetical protein